MLLLTMIMITHPMEPKMRVSPNVLDPHERSGSQRASCVCVRVFCAATLPSPTHTSTCQKERRIVFHNHTHRSTREGNEETVENAVHSGSIVHLAPDRMEMDDNEFSYKLREPTKASLVCKTNTPSTHQMEYQLSSAGIITRLACR